MFLLLFQYLLPTFELLEGRAPAKFIAALPDAELLLPNAPLTPFPESVEGGGGATEGRVEIKLLLLLLLLLFGICCCC